MGISKRIAESNLGNKHGRSSRIRKPCLSHPSGSPVDRVLFLQRTIGNHAVERMIRSMILQPKLRIGKAGDKYEQEADRLADQVMRMPEPKKVSIDNFQIQRACTKCEENELKRQPIKEEDEEEKLQAKAASGTISEINPDMESNIHSLKGGGQPLSKKDRTFFEPRFGQDFSHVRLYTDTRAAKFAEAMNARAFTFGKNVVFGTGQYVPETMSGQKLLAHELTHVVQQENNRQISKNLIQRNITVQNPAAQTPNIPIPFLNMTNSEIVERWINELCPSGNWAVNSGTGVVSSPIRATFCGPRPVRRSAHFSTSGTRTSCKCLCELTAPGSKDIRVHPANTFNVATGGGTASVNVTTAGEGVTTYPGAGRPGYNVGVSGREFVGIEGAGDTSPHSGTGQNQVLRDPPWIIFGHEVCGHARLQTQPMGATQWQHSQTPEGDLGAVDIENRIRREHSTLTNNYGIRKGTFRDATGATHEGSIYRVSSGETLSGIARRTGIPIAGMLNRIWRENGTAITPATQNTLAANERLLIEGIFWHEVIRRETMSSIAAMWNIRLNSLIRANPQISNPNLILPGQMLLIPSS